MYLGEFRETTYVEDCGVVARYSPQEDTALTTVGKLVRKGYQGFLKHRAEGKPQVRVVEKVVEKPVFVERIVEVPVEVPAPAESNFFGDYVPEEFLQEEVAPSQEATPQQV